MEKIIFAKPTTTDFCFVVIYYDAGLCIVDAVFANSAKELNEKIVEDITGVERVEYDVTVFMQEGKDLKEMLYDKDVSVRCYNPKKKLDIRITSQLEWLKENIVINSENNTTDYNKFIELIDENESIALDILSDVAKYYRRMI